MASKKIVVAFVGIEGAGKTWNSHFFAKKYQTSLAMEYGNWYCQNILKGFYNQKERYFLTTKNDYFKIVHKQQVLWQEAIAQANKICFFDSDLIYTKYFIDKQFQNWNWIEAFLPDQPIDLFIFLMTDRPQIKAHNLLKPKEIESETKKLLAYYNKLTFQKMVVVKENNYQLRKLKITKIIDNFISNYEQKNSNSS